jgi:hypothetical protein
LSASVYLTPGGFAPNSDHELIALQRTYYLSTTYIWDGTELLNTASKMAVRKRISEESPDRTTRD